MVIRFRMLRSRRFPRPERQPAATFANQPQGEGIGVWSNDVVVLDPEAESREALAQSQQALLNLVKNAEESMPGGGTLSIRATAANGEALVDVSDTGSGIAPGTDVFLPFFTTKEQGTGLGLIIVRQIVSIHGGTISYRSEPGRGTTFRMTLPLARQMSETAIE